MHEEITHKTQLNHVAWIGSGLDDKMWIGTFGDLHHFDPESKQFLKTNNALKKETFKFQPKFVINFILTRIVYTG